MDAELVVTLGDEVLRTLALLLELSSGPPAQSLIDLYGDAYGRTGTLEVNGRTVQWLPLFTRAAPRHRLT